MNTTTSLSVIGILASLSALGGARPATAPGPSGVEASAQVSVAVETLASPIAVVAAQRPVYLGRAYQFTILSRAGISTTGATSIRGNIGGMTLAPGLYKWGTGLSIPSNGVTLSGDATDVWVFQIAQDLTVSNGADVTLSGGAQANRVFWQVADQATLGTTSEFKGNILCQTQIVLNTGAKLDGRALAQTAVALHANLVRPN